jgi:putative ABC transport system permease protein
VSVRVDHERNLRRAEEEVKATGLETFSLAGLLDQVQLNVLLVSIACSFVAAIAPVAAPPGITNTMLMSALEWQHEIGVMKAVGARSGQVLALFLVEGGLIGVAVGLLTAK